MRYDPVTEKPYCCVPAIFQMIQARRDLPYMTQDEIGWELGLIVPIEMKSKFTKVRTGPKPRAGYGTRTSKPEFSIEKYFTRNTLPLSIIKVSTSSLEELIFTIEASFNQENDIVLCFNSQHLFGDGEIEHVSLVEAFNEASGAVTVVDPAIGAPKRRATTIFRIYDTIQEHEVSSHGGLWIISDRRI